MSDQGGELGRADRSAQAGSASGDGVVAPCPLAAVALELELVDEAGQPVRDAAYQVQAADGKRYAGKTDAEGSARLDGLAPGECVVSFPALDQDCWEFVETVPLAGHPGPPTAEAGATPAPAAPEEHVAEAGECMSSIADRFGFLPATLWEHPGNAGLREERADRNVLKEGDVVKLPAPRRSTAAKPIGKRHRFRRLGVPERLRVRILDALGEPRAGAAYLLELRQRDGEAVESREGSTDAEGFVTEPIPPDAWTGKLLLREADGVREVELRLGTLLPPPELAGVQRRLRNLGYYLGAQEGALDAATTAALEEFQLDYGLEPTGRPDPETARLLQELHLT